VCSLRTEGHNRWTGRPKDRVPCPLTYLEAPVSYRPQIGGWSHFLFVSIAAAISLTVDAFESAGQVVVSQETAQRSGGLWCGSTRSEPSSSKASPSRCRSTRPTAGHRRSKRGYQHRALARSPFFCPCELMVSGPPPC
jgi:hypothetical protein